MTEKGQVTNCFLLQQEPEVGHLKLSNRTAISVMLGRSFHLKPRQLESFRLKTDFCSSIWCLFAELSHRVVKHRYNCSSFVGQVMHPAAALISAVYRGYFVLDKNYCYQYSYLS